MNNPFSTTIVAFESLTQELREVIDKNLPLDSELAAHWMNMVLLHCKKEVLSFDTLDVFDTVYALHHGHATRGQVSGTEHALLDIYIEGSFNIGLKVQAGMFLTRVVNRRDNDDMWFDTLWHEGHSAKRVLQTNLHYHTFFKPVLMGRFSKRNGWLEHLDEHHHMDEALHLFGPWQMASRWREGISKGRLPLGVIEHDAALQQTLWLYMQLDCAVEKSRPPGFDASNALAIDELLNAVPLSIGGAFFLYMNRVPGHNIDSSMECIFKRPHPTVNTRTFFSGLLSLKSRYDEAPQTGHPWLKAQLSWPEPCEMLVMFVSLYQSNSAANDHDFLNVLSNAFEQQTYMSTELPCLE